MNGNIEHTAKVIGIEQNKVTVEMEVEGACASCKVQSACGMSGGGSKIAIIKTPEAAQYSTGEKVMVSVEKSMGIKAVLIAYIFPFLVLVCSLLIMTGVGFNEILAGLSSIIALCIYFILLFMFKSRIEQKIILKIAKI